MTGSLVWYFGYVDYLHVLKLWMMSKSPSHIPAHDIRVFSLATDVGYGAHSGFKVATLMFTTLPSLVLDYKTNNQWNINVQTPELMHILVLDTHFLGMTPLNDVDHLSHKYDCIAISGLASHPFGSWQPKGGDKTFMWIRDALPKHVHGIRTVIYGYDTKLADSQSIERIPDISLQLINSLTTYGWGSRSSKYVIFLAHSLGELVLRDALRHIANGYSKELLHCLRGALFFGVPNLGMEQAYFRAIVQGNPNGDLIDDLALGSEYLRQLRDDLSKTIVNQHFKQFWAYETLQSSTIITTSDGKIDRNGPPAILVSRESATLRFIHNNRSVTFPIKATHSGMVKFTRESPDYHNVVSKISSIVNGELGNDSLNHSYQDSEVETGRGVSPRVMQENTTAQVQGFRRLSCITEAEEAEFQTVTSSGVETEIENIQKNQEDAENLMYMRRLEPVVKSMKEFAEVCEAIGLSLGLLSPMAYVWGPMKYILLATSSYPEAFNCILDAYQEIGEKIPRLQVYRERLAINQHLQHVVVLIYDDIIWFCQR
ncbi:hypothetical protein F4825DRAFT_443498 [Nemania diffusa]|nr:hypothetical protein F4825DRAFT_443498 [Nemania diffusa]